MIKNKRIALIAHDRRKADMVDWAKYNASTLCDNFIVCTGNTGRLVEETLKNYYDLGDFIEEPTINVQKLNSGPMGGDAQIAALVVEGRIDLCVFLIDDLSANPHEADIQMLLRQCRLHNVPVACNRSTADFILTSSLWGTNYVSETPTYIEIPNFDE